MTRCIRDPDVLVSTLFYFINSEPCKTVQYLYCETPNYGIGSRGGGQYLMYMQCHVSQTMLDFIWSFRF